VDTAARSFSPPAAVRTLLPNCPTPAARSLRLAVLISAVCTRTKWRRRESVSRSRLMASEGTGTIVR